MGEEKRVYEPSPGVAQRTKGLRDAARMLLKHRDVARMPLKHRDAQKSLQNHCLGCHPPSTQTSHVVSSHATNTSKTSSPASVMEAIKISDSADNRQGHQLKGTLLSDNRALLTLKKTNNPNLYFFYHFGCIRKLICRLVSN